MAENNVNPNPKSLGIGMNLNSVPSQIANGMTSYALNAVVENFDGNQVSYQNEQANLFCNNPPAGFYVIGVRNIIEDNMKLLWMVNPETGESQIGKLVNCVYTTIIDPVCLDLDINFPILKTAYKKEDCGTSVFWVDARKRPRYLNLDDLPYRVIEAEDPCDNIVTTEIDCNKLNIQANFPIPQLDVVDVDSDGELIAGTYQFAIQYTDADGIEGYTSYYSVTNPLPIFDPNKITLDFNYKVGKSILVKISNLDQSGLFDHVNLAVIKTINNIPQQELVGTFAINGPELTITYTGQSRTDIQLSSQDIFAKYDFYDTAADLTVAQDTLILANLTTHQRISYQEIWSQVTVNWQSWRMPKDSYKDELIATYLKGYMGDEVYPLEGVFLLKNGVQTDGFHIPGRVSRPSDLVEISNNDVLDLEAADCEPQDVSAATWQVYNTATLLGYEQVYLDFLTGITPPSCPNPKVCGIIVIDPLQPECYTGPFQYGEMAYWESTDTYPCNDIYGDLEGKPIRHHKFPDSNISHIHDDEGFIYPKGFKIDVQQIIDLIKNSTLTQEEKDNIQGFKIVRGNRANNKSVVAKGIIHNVGKYSRDDRTYFYPNYPYNDLRADPFLSTVATEDDSGDNWETRLQGFATDDSKERFVLHSPDTSFYQPTLGNILKLETAEFGEMHGHFPLVQKHSRYRFLSSGTYATALVVAGLIGVLSATIGVSTQAFDGTAAFTAFNSFLSIVEKLTPKQNFAFQFTSLGEYTDFKTVPNSGNKQRRADLGFYLEPGMVNRGDDFTINNFQRESAVYFRTTKTLPYPHEILGVPLDESRFINADTNCTQDIGVRPISSYYASVKKGFANQYGQLYSYETIDTGFQFMIDFNKIYQESERYYSVFGGDTFINRFAYKSKLPFFIDNRVGFPDEADVEYNEIPNVAYPIFWMSTDSQADDSGSGGVAGVFKELFGVKLNNFDCRSPKFFYQKGKFYLFAYGIPYFYTESEVNVDLRQAFNDKEGDFFPRVGSDIPDEWLQETNTTIRQDNTYYYNKTYSKQNKENLFTHLPNDWTGDECSTAYPFRAVFAENWYLFKPSAKFDFPENYGSLTSIDGIENRQVLARFEQKTLLYNALLTAPTSAADVYLGQSLFNSSIPPLDYADTDLGYVGSQHKLLLKTQYGHLTTDAIRGQVFLIQGQNAKDITQDIEYQQVSKFFKEFLPFQIKKAFPEVNIDNHFKDIGLTGVFDSKYGRIILTKRDYKPINSDITFSDNKWYVGDTEVSLDDEAYFCNYSFTASYDLENQAWVSFHTYIPNYYIGDTNTFLTGLNSANSSIWEHNKSLTKFNNFYGEIHPYIIEYPYSRQYNDEILQNIKDYSRILKYTNFQEFVETDEDYFNKLIIYSNQQCSGLLELVDKPRHNLSLAQHYPIYNADSKTVTFTKSGSFYQVNTFWDMVVNTKQPIWLQSCENLSIYKELNQENMDYGKRSRKKSPMRSKELRIRFILDDKDDVKIITGFTVAPSQISYK